MEQELLAELLDQAPDAVVFAGVDGMISYWNAAAERVFGFAAADALGHTLDIIVPEAFREAHWRGFDQALAAGETKYVGKALPTRATRADGETIYVELSFAIVHGVDGVVRGAMACARDITERFALDRELRRELRELRKATTAG
ncbi:MAG: PAS domain S-box protein [Chloroflexi bacterium]|nr:PAS domain S-box protein [Chloroflexota bacterium]